MGTATPPRGSVAPRGGVAPCSRRVMNLAHFLRRSARRFPDAVGLAWGERSWTWAELDARVDATAAALAARGIAKGDRVLVQARNGNPLFESMFACFRIGAVWVPTNFRQTPAEVAYLARASGASALICDAGFPDHAAAVRASCPDLGLVVEIGGSGLRDGLRRASSRRTAARPRPTADVEHDDPCWFFFTSGTTGRPKAAVLTHGQMAFVVTNHLCDLMPGTTEARRVARRRAALARRRHPPARPGRARHEDGADRRRPPGPRGGLGARRALAHHQPVHRADHREDADRASGGRRRTTIPRLRHVIYAGAPMYREDQQHALRELGPVLVQYFGLGEVTGNITVLPPAPARGRGRARRQGRHLRDRAHRHAGPDPGRGGA